MNPHALIVADDAKMREELCEMLASRWQVDAAETPARVVTEPGSVRADVVLVALGSEGAALDVASAVRRAGPKTVILLIMGSPSARPLELAQAARVDGILPRPARGDDLALAAEAHLEVARRRRPRARAART